MGREAASAFACLAPIATFAAPVASYDSPSQEPDKPEFKEFTFFGPAPGPMSSSLGASPGVVPVALPGLLWLSGVAA